MHVIQSLMEETKCYLWVNQPSEYPSGNKDKKQMLGFKCTKEAERENVASIVAVIFGVELWMRLDRPFSSWMV